MGAAMEMIGLERIIALPEVSSIIFRFADTFDSSFAIKDTDFKLLFGKETEGQPESYPVKCDGTIIGWVSGEKEAALLAARLSFAAECELDQQALTQSRAGIGGNKTVLQHMEQYLLNFEYAADVIYSLDADFRIASMSASVKRHLGYLPEELIGKPFTELGLLTEESLARAVTDTMRIFNGETVESAEYELVAKDGTVKIAEMRNAPICKDGKVALIVTVARDITDKKKADRALESSEARFRHMAENITNGLIIVEEGKTVYVNDQACRICGYPREELVSFWGPDLTAPEDTPHKDLVLQETRTTGVYPEEVDTWISRKDGTRCCVNLRFSFGYSVERKHTGYVLITDVTERKRAEEAMQDTMNFLDSIIESSLDPIVIGNHLAHIARVNKAFVRLLGYEPAELVGKHLGELFPPGSGLYESNVGSTIEIDESFYSSTYEVMGRMIEEGSVSNVEFYYLSKNRLLIPVEQTMFYVCDKKGERTAVVAICRDISERKRAEKTIIDTRNFMEDIIRTSADGIIVGDTSTAMTMMNEAAERILGYSKEELLGRRTHDFIPRDEWDNRDKLLEEMVSGRKPVCTHEHHWVRKDGRVIDLEVSIGTLRDAKGTVTGFVACARDITEHKAAEKKLYAYQDQLRSLASQLTLAEEQERRRIATEIHDRISQSLALAKIKLGALGAELSLHEENANLAAIRSLLEQCIHDTRSLTFDLSPPFLYELGLRKALEWLLADIEKQHGVRTRLEWNDEAGSYDDDVRILLYQSIRELLINVVKYAQAKTAQVSLHKDDRGLHVLVEDDGKGFLVNPDGFHMSKEGGGFGIFSIQERFQHLGGSIRVESIPHHGTKISLDLPLAQPTD